MKYDYTEYLVEFSNDDLMVYLSGLDKDGFWNHITSWEDVDDPENFAEGVVAAFKEQGQFAQALVSELSDV